MKCWRPGVIYHARNPSLRPKLGDPVFIHETTLNVEKLGEQGLLYARSTWRPGFFTIARGLSERNSSGAERDGGKLSAETTKILRETWETWEILGKILAQVLRVQNSFQSFCVGFLAQEMQKHEMFQRES